MARPVVLIGTGTGVGKTHVAERALRAAAATGAKVLGYKPVESGVVAGDASTDASRLARASSFHVKRPLYYALPTPISPHLAARDAGVAIDLDAILQEVARLASLADLCLVELAGGAFSPFLGTQLVADVVRKIVGARALLVAPDRLGVLHDVGAAARACAIIGLPLEGLILNAPEAPDASTGRNAGELRLVTGVPLLATLARGPADGPLGASDPAHAIAAHLLRR